MFDSELAYFRSTITRDHGDDIAQGLGLPEGAISEIVRNGPFQHLDELAINSIIRELETSFTVTQKRGAVITKDHRPWLAAKRPELDFYYWNRLRKYYLETGILPSHVLATLNSDTDEVLDQCGNPKDDGYGAVRGMVMGNVQSGKTTNYSALICKAADAGYRVIILLAGITNSLRAQTQERLDETFIGKISMFGAAAQQSLPIQNFAATRRIPSYGTTRVSDFSSGKDGIYFGLSGHQEPMIFVTKKNKSILVRLAEWIEKQGETGGYDLPLLLIDDEADNASINTASDPKRTTAINGVIRQICRVFLAPPMSATPPRPSPTFSSTRKRPRKWRQTICFPAILSRRSIRPPIMPVHTGYFAKAAICERGWSGSLTTIARCCHSSIRAATRFPKLPKASGKPSGSSPSHGQSGSFRARAKPTAL